MRKRVIIGVICAILGLVVAFWLGPLLTTVTQETTEVIRLSRNVGQGSEITVNDLEIVNVNPGAIPAGVINDVTQIVGKYAASDLHAGDFLFAAKLTGEGNNADSVLASLDEGKVAISIPITFQGSVSGKLENGDIIRFYIKRNGTDEAAYTPDTLQYVKVITTTTSGGIDQDEIHPNDDGSYEMPATVTVLVTDAQARELANYANGYSMYLSLVYRGDDDTSRSYLAQQDAVLAEKEAKENKNEEPEEPIAPTQPVNNNEPTEPVADADATTDDTNENEVPSDETTPGDSEDDSESEVV